MVLILLLLAPICVDSGLIENLFDRYLSSKAVQAVTTNLGQLFEVMQGAFCSHFRLDMKIHTDKLAAMKLAEQNTYEKLEQQKNFLDLTHGGTSQDNQCNNFRNVLFNNFPLESLDESFFKHKLEDKMQGVLEFDYVSTTKIQSINNSQLHNSVDRKAMEWKAFHNLIRTCGVYVAPELSKTRERKGYDMGLLVDMVHASSPSPSTSPSPSKKEEATLERSFERREAIVHHKDSTTPLSKTKEIFLSSVQKIRKQVQHKKLYLQQSGSSDYKISMPEMLEWLTEKAPEVSGWNAKDALATFNHFTSNVIEFAGTTPPTRISHCVNLRFLHKRKNLALEYTVCSAEGLKADGKAWIGSPMEVAKERPAACVLKEAVRLSSEIFSEYRLGLDLGERRKQHPQVSAVLRSTDVKSENFFEPKQLDGVNSVCTVYYVDVTVDRLPEPLVTRKKGKHFVSTGAAEFSTTADESGLFKGEKVRWVWTPLDAVEDVQVSFKDEMEKIRRIKMMLGTRILTCEQGEFAFWSLLEPFGRREYEPLLNQPTHTQLTLRAFFRSAQPGSWRCSFRFKRRSTSSTTTNK